MNRLQADFLLLITALIWGTTFVAQRDAAGHVGPILFVAVRFTLSALVLAPIALWEARRSEVRLRAADLRGALVIGACLCAGCWLQQIALVTTSASNGGFLTAVYIVIVPLVAWVFTRRPPRPVVLAATLIALGGAWLLAGASSGGGWNRGDLIILGSDLIWALHITLVGHYARGGARPVFLALMQNGITGLASLPVALLLEPFDVPGLLAVAPAILYGGIVSSGIAFTLQVIAQRHTPSAEAALIMSLECVFAAIAGALLLGERLSGAAWAGAALILVSVVLVEAGPLLRRARETRERPVTTAGEVEG